MTLTDAERRLVLELADELAARYGVRPDLLPGMAEILGGGDGKAARQAERRREFAARYGVREQDVPDFGEEGQGD